MSALGVALTFNHAAGGTESTWACRSAWTTKHSWTTKTWTTKTWTTDSARTSKPVWPKSARPRAAARTIESARAAKPARYSRPPQSSGIAGLLRASEASCSAGLVQVPGLPRSTGSRITAIGRLASASVEMDRLHMQLAATSDSGRDDGTHRFVCREIGGMATDDLQSGAKA